MTDQTPKRGRGRPRREGADEEILGVALELLRASGYRGLNIDVVAERAGVAKTTIYRRWPSKGALIAAAIAPPRAGATHDELVEETRALLAMLGEPEGDMIEVFRAILAPRHQALGGGEEADRVLGALVLRSLLKAES